MFDSTEIVDNLLRLATLLFLLYLWKRRKKYDDNNHIQKKIQSECTSKDCSTSDFLD